MTEHVPVDPANGTEPYAEDVAAAPKGASDAARTAPTDSPGPDAAAAATAFTAPEKLTSVVRAVLSKPSGNHTVAALLGFLASPFGRHLVVKPMLSLLPPLDDPEAWDAWLALLVGCGLELVSDGVEVDVAGARGQARELLQALFDEDEAAG